MHSRFFFSFICVFGCFVLLAPVGLAAQPLYSTSADYLLPEFESAAPKFCWLEFPSGEDRTQTILAALDQSNLYLDLNANKDLTESGERITAKKQKGMLDPGNEFQKPMLKVGNKVHRSFLLTVTRLEHQDKNDPRIQSILQNQPAANSYELTVEIDRDSVTGIGIDGRVPVRVGYRDLSGILQFGTNLTNAPRIRFAGAFEIRLSELPKLRAGSTSEINLVYGISGNGPGTFASFYYQGIVPEAAFPSLTLEQNDQNQTDGQVAIYDITRRC